MSLLQLLNLPQPKHLALVQGGPSMPLAASASVASGAAPPHGSKPAEPKGAHANGSGEADVHAEAKKARGAIEAREKEARETLLRFNKLAPLLDQKIAAATGDAKKKLLEQKGQFDKKTAEAVKTVDQARADLEVIDNPDSGREELVKIMARHRTVGKVSEEMEISSPGLDSTKKKVNQDVTTTTTAYEKGKATIETEHDKQHVGPGGVTREHSHEKEVHSADSIARNKEEKKSHVSVLGKASVEEKTVAEVELRDGRKSSVEHSTAKEINAKGAEKSETHKVTNLDGSSTATTKKQGVERGEGHVTATSSRSVTQTSKTGTAHTTDKKASGGFDAKDGAIGAHGGLDGGKSVTSKKGLQAGFVAGVHANVKCQIGEPKGDPKMYEVTLTVSFVATVGASAGAGKKEGSQAAIGIEVKGSLEKSMSLTHTLSEAQLGDYTQALQDASKKGGKVSATHKEFAVISAGVNQGWEAARSMWSKQPVSKATADTLTHAGDSVTATEKKTGSLGGSLKVKGVGVAIGVTDSQEDSKKMTRNDKGGLDVDTNSAHTRQKSLSASVYVGVAGMEVGTVHTQQTSFGFSITIDPKYDADGKILAALNLCETELQYNIFIATHPGKAVTVTGKMKGESDAERTNTGASLGGMKASIFTQQSVSKEQKFDGAGKLVHSKIVGGAGVGGGWRGGRHGHQEREGHPPYRQGPEAHWPDRDHGPGSLGPRASSNAGTGRLGSSHKRDREGEGRSERRCRPAGRLHRLRPDRSARDGHDVRPRRQCHQHRLGLRVSRPPEGLARRLRALDRSAVRAGAREARRHQSGHRRGARLVNVGRRRLALHAVLPGEGFRKARAPGGDARRHHEPA